MSLTAKLRKWVDAGLITAEQQTRIIAHEKNHSANRWKHGVGMAGLFSILLGISLIVASNWQEISDTVKLGFHFAVNITLTAFIWRWHHDRTRDNHREVALFALWGLTLTLIALIGQIFQLGGDYMTAVRVWFFLTTPMILLFAQSRYTAQLWALVFILYVPADLMHWIGRWPVSDDVRSSVALAIATFLPLGFWGLGAVPRFAVNRPTMARTIRALSILLALIGASMAGVLFYAGSHMQPPMTHTPLIAVILGASIAVMRFPLQKLKALNAADRTSIDLLCLAGVFTCIPFALLNLHMESGAAELVHFVTLWLTVGALWQQAGYSRLVSASIWLITIRLYIGFLELFGSMMMSGLGFIVMGLALIGLMKGARFLDKRLKGGAA